MELGQRIRAYRLAKGLTQTQVAEGCITRNMLSQIENGQATPSMKTLEHLAKIFEVPLGVLLSDEGFDPLFTAKEKFSSQDFSGAIDTVRDSGATGDECEYLLALCHGELAQEALFSDDLPLARTHAETALRHNGQSLYCSMEIEMHMRWVLAKCSFGHAEEETAMEEFRKQYTQWGWEAKHHLLLAKHHLLQKQSQLAEREIWTITSLPESQRPNYLLLRGWLSVLQEKYQTAISYLTQILDMEPLPRYLKRELYTLLEQAYRELDDYKSAYEYASKLREL